jgi:hypothetical protein
MSMWGENIANQLPWLGLCSPLRQGPGRRLLAREAPLSKEGVLSRVNLGTGLGLVELRNVITAYIRFNTCKDLKHRWK